MIINLASQQICFLLPPCSVDLFGKDLILSDTAASFRKGKPSPLLTPTQLVSQFSMYSSKREHILPELTTFKKTKEKKTN